MNGHALILAGVFVSCFSVAVRAQQLIIGDTITLNETLGFECDRWRRSQDDVIYRKQVLVRTKGHRANYGKGVVLFETGGIYSLGESSGQLWTCGATWLVDSLHQELQETCVEGARSGYILVHLCGSVVYLGIQPLYIRNSPTSPFRKRRVPTFCLLQSDSSLSIVSPLLTPQ